MKTYHDELFTPADADEFTKVTCTVCGRSGYPADPSFEHGWQNACRAGHPFKCTCGRLFSTKGGLAGHFRQIARHKATGEHSAVDVSRETS